MPEYSIYSSSFSLTAAHDHAKSNWQWVFPALAAVRYCHDFCLSSTTVYTTIHHFSTSTLHPPPHPSLLLSSPWLARQFRRRYPGAAHLQQVTKRRQPSSASANSNKCLAYLSPKPTSFSKKSSTSAQSQMSRVTSQLLCQIAMFSSRRETIWRCSRDSEESKARRKWRP